jgi:hypothetical protein
MVSERVILCGGIESPSGMQVAKEPVHLHLSGINPNIALRIQDISKSSAANISDVFKDLVEIATYVYCADQAITRGGKADKGLGANWRRRLRFQIPVRRPDIWSSPKINECLCNILEFLSDDFYTFEFKKLKHPPPFEKYLEGLGDPNLRPDGIVLFSGGLDSLAGAVKEAVIEKRQIILVSHRSAPKILTKQRNLIDELAKHCVNPPLHVPVWIRKHGNWGREFTQRTRSFLYAGLGATIAQIFNIPKIGMYENGVVSLNLPISAQVIGARATRSTHPIVISGFSQLFSLIMDKPFEVQNPFLWNTRADLVKSIVEAGCADLIKYTVSCAHVMEMTGLHTHCGKCSQCIDRRFAILSTGNGKYDPPEMYKVDLLTGARESIEDKTMLESFVRTATEVIKMTEMQFFSRFGEATRALTYIEGTADEIASKIFDLNQHHAREIYNVVQAALKDHAHEILKETLPPSCLIILSLPEKYKRFSESQMVEPEPSSNIFHREGDYWRIIYDRMQILLKDSKGLRYIAYLLRYPEQDFHVLRLIHEVEGPQSNNNGDIHKKMEKRKLPEEGLVISNFGDAGEVIDAQALAEYRQKIKDLEEEIREAEDNIDLARLEKLRDEKEFLENQILAASGVMGRTRKFDDPVEKARKSITNRINDSRKKIQEDHPTLGQHLMNCIKTGPFCSYTPDKPTFWEL